MTEQIAVIGVGYVGLPVALAFGRRFPCTIGFDIDRAKTEALSEGIDRTGEHAPSEILSSRVLFTSNLDDLRGTTFFVVAVPTPIDSMNKPDLTPLVRASETVGRVLTPGAVVVYESTVYPGVTEDVCGPALERVSGLRRGIDFKLGYSPERINPGDKEHTLETVTKIVSGEDKDTLERVARTYEVIVKAGVHRASSIKVAEAAKVIENTQRDLNIALMNEIALICDRMNLPTRDVLAAAETKWNFLKFRPGLVGGHCIGVDPYYLTTKAEELGYHPQVILAGRRVNDGMGRYLAQRMVKLLIDADVHLIKTARVGVLGLTFKENVSDVRNSRVPELVDELRQFGIEPVVHDPMADPEEVAREYGIHLVPLEEFNALDGLIVAVSHKPYRAMQNGSLSSCLKTGGVIMDVKSIVQPEQLPQDVVYWSL